MNAIDGKSPLSQADYDLAVFHIQNGTAIGYAFLSASYAAIQSQQTQRANITRHPDQYYEVDGATATEAWNNADVNRATGKCTPGKRGCTAVKDLTNAVGSPGYSYQEVKGGYRITEDPFSPQVSGEVTVYLPKWAGYDSASDSEKAAWDKMMASLKDHEEGHVEIVVQEASKTASELAKTLPKSRSFIVKDKEEMDAAVSGRYIQANRVVADGWNRWYLRNKKYDDITGHGKIPRSGVNY